MKHFIFKLINDKIQSCDFYNHNQSFWLIETNEKKWVFELTKEKILWYNFYFFENIFNFFSLDVVENQHYITEWVEDYIQNVVNYTGSNTRDESHQVENTIQNGVKKIHWVQYSNLRSVENTIQNGIKETKSPGADGDLLSTIEWVESNNTKSVPEMIDNIITNGIKETIDQWNQNRPSVKDVIEKGVKETTPSGYLGSIEIKGKLVHQFESPKQNNEVEDTIQNGVKKTHINYNDEPLRVEDTIQNGVKEIGLHKGVRPSAVKDTIQNGIKETNWRTVDNFPEFEERVIQNGIKETWGYEKQNSIRINQIILSGKTNFFN